MMDKAYWLNRWETGNTRFNEPCPHRYLVNHINKIAPGVNNTVFIPLCGKSIDMSWLLSQRQKLIGVEISPIPIRAFFMENNLESSISYTDNFTVYRNSSCTIYQGDIFNLTSEHILEVSAVYDRGAFIPLPPGSLREQYVNWLKHTLPDRINILLVTFEFDPKEMSGPPFPVTTDELVSMFADTFSVTLIERQYVDSIKPHWQARGLKTLHECVYLLTKF